MWYWILKHFKCGTTLRSESQQSTAEQVAEAAVNRDVKIIKTKLLYS